MKGTDYKGYLGVDVGKYNHTACATDDSGKELFVVELKNTEEDLLELMSRVGKGFLVTVDQKRNIGMLTIRCARSCGLEVAYLPGHSMKKARDLYPGIAKTDVHDSRVISWASRAIPESLLPIAEEDSSSEKLRRFAAQYADLLCDQTHQKNRLRAMLLESNPAFEMAIDLGCSWNVSLLATLGGPWNILDAGKRRFNNWAEKTPYASTEKCGAIWCTLKAVSRVTQGQVEAEGYLVKSIASRIAAIDEEMARVAKIIDNGLKGDAVYQALQTIPGIGKRTASQLVLTIDITEFKDHDALASFCGLAPQNRQSGKTINSVTSSKKGNRALKNLLIFSCMSLIGTDNYYGRYYDACRARNMKHLKALKAVARKRLKVIYAIMRDAVPYAA